MATSKKKVTKKATKKKVVKKKATKKVVLDNDYIIETKDEDYPQIKYKFGRPTVFHKKFCDYAIHYLAKGYSKQALAGKLMVAVKTLYEWVKADEDFCNAISIGESLSRIWYDELTRNHTLHSKNGMQINSQVYSLNMKNRFNWQDKKELKIDDETKKTFAFVLDNKPEGR